MGFSLGIVVGTVIAALGFIGLAKKECYSTPERTEYMDKLQKSEGEVNQ